MLVVVSIPAHAMMNSKEASLKIKAVRDNSLTPKALRRADRAAHQRKAIIGKKMVGDTGIEPVTTPV